MPKSTAKGASQSDSFFDQKIPSNPNAWDKEKEDIFIIYLCYAFAGQLFRNAHELTKVEKVYFFLFENLKAKI